MRKLEFQNNDVQELYRSDDDNVSLFQRPSFRDFFTWRNPKFRLSSYLFLIIFLIILIIVALYETLKQKKSETNGALLLSKPFNDKRSFYLYKLENGLQALFILDPECINPGSAVSINAGSKQEGKVQGLAHLLEHVLFMGSKNYPLEDYFFTTISMLSGNSNAFTSNDATVYYWSIKQNNDGGKQFDQIMDVWRDFFENPFINEEKVNREIYAVNSEYLSYLNSPEFQLDFLMKIMMNPRSPNADFGYGSLESFRVEGVNLTDELNGFFNKYYAADQMNLVLLGNFTLKEMTDKAENMFGGLKKGGKDREKQKVLPDTEGFWRGKMAKFKQVHGKTLILAWILPELLSNYRVNPLEYWLDLLNSEHQFGLIWTLKSMGWIEGFLAKPYGYEIDLTVFTVNFQLTDLGYQNLDEIIEYFFAYVTRIDDGITKERWTKLKRVRELAYDYNNLGDETNEIANIAYSLSIIPKNKASDIFRFIGNLLQDYSYQDIHNIAQLLGLERSLIIMGYDEYGNSSQIETNEKLSTFSYFKDFYLSNYSELYAMVWESSELAKSEIKKLKNAAENKFQDLNLPPDNKYIPNNLLMPCKDPALCEDYEVNKDLKSNPNLIFSGENYKVWHKIQRNFNKLDPKSSIHFQIISPLTYNSSKAVFLNHLTRKWLKWHFKPAFQQLEALGYNIIVNYKPNFELKIYGFSNKMDLIAKELGQIIKNCSDLNYMRENPLVFNMVKNITLQRIRKKMVAQPLKQASQHLRILLNKNSYNLSELIQMQEISVDEFGQFLQEFTQSNSIKMLIMGAISENQATDVWHKFTSEGLNSQPPQSLPHYQTIKLPKSTSHFIALNNNPDDVNTGFISYLELGINDILTIGDFLIFYDFFFSKAFDFLRTKAQLGYYAGARPLIVNGVMGFMIWIQGETKNISIFEEKVEEFLESFLINLDEVTENEFLMMREAKINDLSKISKLEDLEKKVWGILEGNLEEQWDIIEKTAETMKNIDSQTCKDFWRNIITKRNEFGRLIVAVVPQNLKTEYESQLIKYEDFKSRIDSYEEIKEKLNVLIS